MATKPRGGKGLSGRTTQKKNFAASPGQPRKHFVSLISKSLILWYLNSFYSIFLNLEMFQILTIFPFWTLAIYVFPDFQDWVRTWVLEKIRWKNDLVCSKDFCGIYYFHLFISVGRRRVFDIFFSTISGLKEPDF